VHPWNFSFHFSFFNLRQSVGLLGRGFSPSQGRYLTHTQKKHRQTFMPWIEFEPTIPVLRRAKTVHVLDRTAAVIDPLSTSATNWPIVPSPDNRWWMWSSRWNDNWQGKLKYSEKTYPSTTLSTTNPSWPDLGLNPGRRGGKSATNRLS
jgi:hypothetical protein